MATPKKLLKLGEQLLTDPLANANHTTILLSVLATAGDKNEEKPKAAIRAMQLFFSDSMQRGELNPGQPQEAGDVAEHEASSVHRVWLHRQFTLYQEQVAGLFTRETKPGVQIAALAAVLELARTEKGSLFAPSFFSRVLKSVLCSRHATPEALSALAAKYLEYTDVRYYVFRAIHKVARQAAKPAAGTKGRHRLISEENEVSAEDLVHNLYAILSQAKPLAESGAASQQSAEGEEGRQTAKSWCGGLEAGTVVPSNMSEGSKQRKKRRRLEDAQEELGLNSEADSGKHPAKWATPLFQKKAFSEAWLAFLQLPLPQDIYKKVLVRMHEDIIPHMANPLLLADLLTGALDAAGLIGMLALHAIFVLVTKHRLEYPAFYARLYQLLQPSAFYAKQRGRFFQLADIFLSSGLVPAYTVAAFVKRFARLALTTPPAGALVCLAFVHNLLRRHPACLVLVDRQPAAEAEVAGTAGVDQYIDSEDDPANSRAIDSSLWELKSLQSHYYTQVATFASQILEKDLGDRKKTSEVDIAPYIGGSYSSLIKLELGRRIKQIPTAFYQEPPDKLFDARSAEDFVGWSF